MTNQHEASPDRTEHLPWTHCITPTECAAHNIRQCAHGHILVRETCSCGAVRYGERNQNCTNYGPWQEPAL
jgi:hypothetical protein